MEVIRVLGTLMVHVIHVKSAPRRIGLSKLCLLFSKGQILLELVSLSCIRVEFLNHDAR